MTEGTTIRTTEDAIRAAHRERARAAASAWEWLFGKARS